MAVRRIQEVSGKTEQDRSCGVTMILLDKAGSRVDCSQSVTNEALCRILWAVSGIEGSKLRRKWKWSRESSVVIP